MHIATPSGNSDAELALAIRAGAIEPDAPAVVRAVAQTVHNKLLVATPRDLPARGLRGG